MPQKLRISKPVIIIAAIVLVVLIFAVVCKILSGNREKIRGQHLNSYSFSSGGGMTGGYHRETVQRFGDRALISIEQAEWHSQDPTVAEYLTDAAVLDELEEIVRKYGMNLWDGKKFTDEIVCDGESKSYSFDFGGEYISFSSQIYPAEYGNKLSMLDSTVKKYIESGEKLPGLVNARTAEQENYSLPENELLIYVCSYVGNSLGVRVLNGTDDEIKISEEYTLSDADTDAVLSEGDNPYGGVFYGHTRDEMYIALNEKNDKLKAGSYKLILGDIVIPFEIR